MPIRNRAPVVGVGCPLRVGQLDEAVARLTDEAAADLAPQRHQVALLLALVHREEHLGVVERLDRLHGHVVGIAGADADDVNVPAHYDAPDLVARQIAESQPPEA